jgi:hypothetical protein
MYNVNMLFDYRDSLVAILIAIIVDSLIKTSQSFIQNGGGHIHLQALLLWRFLVMMQ